jgi:hypothetical protein
MAEYEVHGPEEALPMLTDSPVEVTPDAPLETPARHWYDFLTNW